MLSSQKVDQYFSNLFEVRNGLLWTDLDFTEGMEERKVYAYAVSYTHLESENLNG